MATTLNDQLFAGVGVLKGEQNPNEAVNKATGTYTDNVTKAASPGFQTRPKSTVNPFGRMG